MVWELEIDSAYHSIKYRTNVDRIMRTRALIASWIVALTLNGAGTVVAADGIGAATGDPLTVVLLPAQVTVFKLGLQTRPFDEWTAAARSSVDIAIREVVDRSASFKSVETPSLTPEERAAIEEFQAVVTLVQAEVQGYGELRLAKAIRGRIDRTLGPSLSFLQDRTGADYALGAVALQVEQSQGVVAVSALGAVASVLAPPLVLLPTVTGSEAALFLADLRSGELRWLNGSSGYEVGGYNFTDLRDPQSARKVVAKLLEPYPEIPALRGNKGVPTAAADGLSVQSTSPMQGGFAIRAPAAWRVKDDQDDVVTMTRDGRLLNEITVELRPHSLAFPESAQESARDSSPSQLAQWYAAELQSQKIRDLQIGEVSLGTQLAGQEAFRIQSSYRLPIESGGARIEQVTIGTAVPHGLLIARLTAPQLSYYARALPSFEESVRTIVLKRRRRTR